MCSKQNGKCKFKCFSQDSKSKSKTLISHISCECKYGFGDRKFNLNQKCNNNKC